MSTPAEIFSKAATEKVKDSAHHFKLKKAFSAYPQKKTDAMEQFSSEELAKNRAAAVKQRVIENLEKYLIEFESNFNKNGGKLFWAQNAEEALSHVLQIVKQENVRSVIKGKSMVAEEIGLNQHLLNHGIMATETDLGEFIQQLSGEAPYHIVLPAIHKSADDVAALFRDQLKSGAATPEDCVDAARKYLRSALRENKIGITGANFLLADSGGIAITENEGNALFCASAEVHVVISSIEKLLPSIRDLELFWPLLSSHGTGQRLTAFNHVVHGPDESQGVKKFFLILLDNGRSEVLAKTEQRRALACIRCGACYNVCPVYKQIGGHAYGHTYGGPIGKVIAPLMSGLNEYGHLSQATSLCGACTNVCPVKIDLHRLMLYNRRDADKGSAENMVWSAWKKGMLSRKLMDKGGAFAKNTMLTLFFSKAWGKERQLPKVAPKSFNQLMRERMKKVL